MKRVKEVPPELLAYIEKRRQVVDPASVQSDIFCTLPVRAVKMSITRPESDQPFHTVIVPATDIYTMGKAQLKKGFLKRDALSYFVAGTRKAFPYGHVYESSGHICLGSIFVPSAVPEYSAAMPLETLFLHNDRNLSHGNSHLHIDRAAAKEIRDLIRANNIRFSFYGWNVRDGVDIIACDEIWNLSVDVVEQKPLPEALQIMSHVYHIVFRKDREKEKERRRQEMERQEAEARETADIETEE